MSVIVNLNYKWEGINQIIRVYVFVFAFYLIYIYSSLDVQLLRDRYLRLYGRIGNLLLFFIMRITPLLLIYLVVFAYTIIIQLGHNNWPYKPILSVLNGANSNIVIYSLILLLILKIKTSPKITIPLFLSSGVLYYIFYQIVYTDKTAGLTISGLKFVNYFAIVFFLVFEFSVGSYFKRIIKSLISSLSIGLLFYFVIVSLFFSIYRFSSYGSYSQIKTGQYLLNMGYSFPFKKISRIALVNMNDSYIQDIIHYSIQYNKNLDYTVNEWEKLILRKSIIFSDHTSKYLTNKNILIDYNKLITFVEKESTKSGNLLVNSKYFIKYASKYFERYSFDLSARMKKNNLFFNLWAIEVIRESRSQNGIPILIDLLSDINADISQKSYIALKFITGVDPAKDYNVQKNDVKVINKFKEFYSGSRKR